MSESMKSLPGYRPVAVLHISLDGNIRFSSDRACDLFGYPKEELLRLRIPDIAPGIGEDAAAAYFREIPAEGPAMFHGGLRRKDGSVFPALLVCDYRGTGDGSGGAVVVFIHDLSAEDRMERALRESEQLLRKSQEVARLGSFILDVGSGTWVASPALRRIGGIPDGYAGTVETWLELVAPDQREEMRGLFDRCLAAGRGRIDKEHRILRRDTGEERWLHCRGEMELDGSGNPARMIGTVQDITERKRAEQERESLEERLRQSRKWGTVGRLAGGVAHEYNNMLSVILGYAELIHDRLPEGEPLRSFAEEIEKAGGRARDITSQLLAFSRRQPMAPKVADLNGLVKNGIRTLGRILAERIRIDFTPGDDLWEIKVDPAQFGQILVELAMNARDAMPDGGRMTLKTANVRFDAPMPRDGFSVPPGDYVRLNVSDEGVGMDRETVSHLFEPFFSTKGVGKGTGLGLSTVYGIVKQNGGFIEVYSAPGKGTTFRILFPRAVEHPAAAEAMARPAEAGGPAMSVLLVEDEEMVRNMATRLLEELGYRVACAGSPAEALSFLARPGFVLDLLVSDVVMPGMSGPELWKRVRALRPEAKALFLSAYPPGSVETAGEIEEGACFIGKPFTRTGLAEAVREAILRR